MKLENKKLAEEIQGVLEDKKAIDVELISVSEKTVLADFFVIASGHSTTQIRALAEEVEYQIKNRYGILPDHIEGSAGNHWILMDYKDIVVHIFHPQERSEYSLEKLWHLKRPDASISAEI